MLLALISDIHSNLPALEAVMEDIQGTRAEMILCAGDLIGYGARPNEVIERVRRARIESIRGNHDAAVAGNDYSWFNDDAGDALKWTAERLKEGNSLFLRDLRTESRLDCGGKRLAVFHGSPKDPNRYVFPGEEGEWVIEDAEADIAVLGHTHHPVMARFGEGLVLNPGSVGQPRDGDPRASYCLLEIRDGAARPVFRRVEYDIEAAAKAILEAGLPQRFAQRLYWGV